MDHVQKYHVIISFLELGFSHEFAHPCRYLQREGGRGEWEWEWEWQTARAQCMYAIHSYTSYVITFFQCIIKQCGFMHHFDFSCSSMIKDTYTIHNEFFIWDLNSLILRNHLTHDRFV